MYSIIQKIAQKFMILWIYLVEQPTLAYNKA